MLNATKAHIAPACREPPQLNIFAKPVHIETEFSEAFPMPYSTPKVETRFSLAIRADIEAAVACQFAKPRGANIQHRAPPIPAKTEKSM